MPLIDHASRGGFSPDPARASLCQRAWPETTDVASFNFGASGDDEPGGSSPARGAVREPRHVDRRPHAENARQCSTLEEEPSRERRSCLPHERRLVWGEALAVPASRAFGSPGQALKRHEVARTLRMGGCARLMFSSRRRWQSFGDSPRWTRTAPQVKLCAVALDRDPLG
jgi:hypothetical protein